jgi:ABC-type sugar transport system ATPase subunit
VNAEERLRVEDVSLIPGAERHNETILRGEIVGLAGLDGHGQEAFLEILAGLRRPASGGVFVRRPIGDVVAVTGFRQATRCGIAYLARDRRANGIFPSLSILDNFAMVTLADDTRFGLINARKRRRRFEAYREQLSIVAAAGDNAITTLSGGNQQKVLLARWLAREPRILLLNDPTRGVDQRTRETLYTTFRELARDAGMALVVLSSELEELVRLCDRVLVFREHRLAARLSGAAIGSETVIAAMFGRRT